MEKYKFFFFLGKGHKKRRHDDDEHRGCLGVDLGVPSLTRTSSLVLLQAHKELLLKNLIEALFLSLSIFCFSSSVL